MNEIKLFCYFDAEKLNERVRHLLNQNEELERKLKWTQDRLKELASEKGVIWLESMLSFCKYEIIKRVTTCIEYIGNFIFNHFLL